MKIEERRGRGRKREEIRGEETRVQERKEDEKGEDKEFGGEKIRRKETTEVKRGGKGKR